ncbi:hypothetical protein V8D89_012164 [Ganoderma adspersum]
MSSLPPELWGLVINLLQQRDHITCLSVSKMHHDLAFPNVFSHVRVTFGLWIWRPWRRAGKRLRPSSNEREHMVRGNHITLDFLRAIPFRPDLAKVITRLTVYACVWEDSEVDDGQQHLTAALKALPSLEVFHWHGQRPKPSSAIFQALEVGSLTTLTEIHIPMLYEDVDALLPHICHFPNVRSLSLIRQGSWDGPGHNIDAMVNNEVDIRTGTLARLSISGDVIWRRGSFSGLQELELIFTMSYEFADVLRHCTGLTSLTLLPVELARPDEIFPAFGAHPNALPRLTAFKYLNPMGSEAPITSEDVAALCDFLRNKKHLRRLDVALHMDDREDDLYLELLRELPALEVLGFDSARGDWVPSEDIAFFERVIPARLSALRVGQLVLVHEPDLCAAYRAEWLKLFKSRTSLRYLHVFESFIALPKTDTALRLRQLPIEELPDSLELYGYGLYMYPVVRVPSDNVGADGDNNTARAAFGPCWPLEKVAFRTKGDFECEDWEWLFRWHGYAGLADMLRPGVLPNGPPLMLNPHVPLQVRSS